MPIFEYRCEKCGQVTEFLESYQGRKEHICSRCGSKRMSKLLSAFGMQGSTGGSCAPGGSAFS